MGHFRYLSTWLWLVLYDYYFFVEIWSWLADKLHFILSYEVGFYKPAILIVHPPFCRITPHATMPGYFPLNICSRLLIQMNDAWKMVFSVGGLNPRALSHESSALTTRPWLLAMACSLLWIYYFSELRAQKKIALLKIKINPCTNIQINDHCTPPPPCVHLCL